MIYPADIDKLIDVLKILNETSIPYRVLGKMSNVLFKNSVYNGVIIKTDRINALFINDETVVLECGCSFPASLKFIAEKNIGGFEGLWGIPGSVGGMLKQNAGAFGYTVSDKFLNCRVYDIYTSEIITMSKADMCFGYRTSILDDNRYVLLDSVFCGEYMPINDIYAKVREYSELRRKSQPVTRPSLGCVFKSVDGVSAGKLIDMLGLKGFSVGGAVISDKHAGFIVNSGVATANDVLDLIEYIKKRVFREFGITLIEEIEII